MTDLSILTTSDSLIVRSLKSVAGARVSADEMILSRFIGRGVYKKLPFLGSDAVIQVAMAGKELDNWDDCCTFRGSFGEIECNGGYRLMRALTGIEIDDPLDRESMMSQWLHASMIGRLGMSPFSCVEQVDKERRQSIDGMTTLCITLRSGQHAFSVSARADPASWLNFFGGEEWNRCRLNVNGFLHIVQDIGISIARHTLSIEHLEYVHAGDIFLPTNPAFSCNGEGVIPLGCFLSQVSFIAPSALEIKKMESKVSQEKIQGQDEHASIERVDLCDTESESSDGAGTSSLDNYSITLDFELGKLRITLGELRTLDVGSILKISGGSAAKISIRAGGRVLGIGEVVDVNGQLGIRVTRWSQDK